MDGAPKRCGTEAGLNGEKAQSILSRGTGKGLKPWGQKIQGSTEKGEDAEEQWQQRQQGEAVPIQAVLGC